MITARLFKNGRSQAVRLPKECRFNSREVGIVKLGDAVLLFPKDKAIEIMKSALGKFTPDFMATRDQPMEADKREPL